MPLGDRVGTDRGGACEGHKERGAGQINLKRIRPTGGSMRQTGRSMPRTKLRGWNLRPDRKAASVRTTTNFENSEGWIRIPAKGMVIHRRAPPISAPKPGMKQPAGSPQEAT